MGFKKVLADLQEESTCGGWKAAAAWWGAACWAAALGSTGALASAHDALFCMRSTSPLSACRKILWKSCLCPASTSCMCITTGVEQPQHDALWACKDDLVLNHMLH